MRAKPESTIISEIESESTIKHEIFNKKIDFLTIFTKEISKARFPLGEFVRATRSENKNPAT